MCMGAWVHVHSLMMVILAVLSIEWPATTATRVYVLHVHVHVHVHVVSLLSSIKHDSLRHNIMWTFASTQVLQSVL